MDLAEQSPTSSAADVNKLSCAIHPIPRVCNNNYRARLTTLTGGLGTLVPSMHQTGW
jgi:hypothetical protein